MPQRTMPMPMPMPATTRSAALAVLLLCIAALGISSIAPHAAAAPPSADFALPIGEEPGKTSLLEAFFIQRNERTGRVEWLGTLIIWALLAGSAASWALIITLHRSNRREDIVPAELVSKVRSAIERRDIPAARAAVADHPSHFARTVRDALAEADHGWEAMLRALERAADEHATRRFRRIEA
ncbi:MAG: hypothetical protein VYC34_01490, partial [Planctomycetota bacterium]|nr:hypothetical protein [Planctomycetota bacterium]